MEKRVNFTWRVLQIVFLVVILAGIRFFESELFYDPLIRFFKSDYLLNKIPQMNMAKLMLNLSFRFALNTLISLGIIYIAFRNKNILKFSMILYLILYVLGFSIFIFLVLNMGHEHYLSLFYVRRFLIHPVFVMILLPAFYYYRLTKRWKK